MRRRDCLTLLLGAALSAGRRLNAAESQLAGRLTATGSDTLAPLCLAWLEQLKAAHPQLSVEMQAGGSATAVKALIEGSTDLGPMSRSMSQAELDAFRARHGFEPTPVLVALDAIAVVVHPGNPLRQISLAEIDACYSSSRWCAARPAVEHWGDLGLDGDWRDRPLRRYGRNTASGTFEQFRRLALCGGDYRPDVGQMMASAAVARAVSQDRLAIGVLSVGSVDDSVRALAVGGSDGRVVEPTANAVASSHYPLSRPLLIYLRQAPGEPLRPLVAEFLKVALSAHGQRRVPATGLIALPGWRRRAELQRLFGADAAAPSDP